MQIGDTYRFTPSAFTDEKSGALPGRKPMPRELVGKIVYVHPQRHYFTVAAEVNGQTIRESFQCGEEHRRKH